MKPLSKSLLAGNKKYQSACIHTYTHAVLHAEMECLQGVRERRQQPVCIPRDLHMKGMTGKKLLLSECLLCFL